VSRVPFYWLLVGALAVWRITHLLNAEDGPWNVLSKVRRLAGNGMVGSLLDCFYCLSLWVAAPFAYGLGENSWERVLLWPALSGAAIVVQNISQRNVQPSIYYEESEREHVLRKEPDIVAASEARDSQP